MIHNITISSKKMLFRLKTYSSANILPAQKRKKVASAAEMDCSIKNNVFFICLFLLVFVVSKFCFQIFIKSFVFSYKSIFPVWINLSKEKGNSHLQCPFTEDLGMVG